jgi:hypothetical protein
MIRRWWSYLLRPTLIQPAASPDCYYFFHIEKTAGTTVSHLLASQFAAHQVLQRPHWSQLAHISPQQLSQYRLFMGHYFNFLPLKLGLPLHKITFLRHPIERALSDYSRIWHNPPHYLHARARQLGSLEAFLRDPRTQPVLRNYQAFCLSQLPPRTLLEQGFSPDEMIGWVQSRGWAQAGQGQLSDRVLLEQSLEELQTFAAVGITERLDESMQQIARRFGWQFPAETQPVRLNTNPRRLPREAVSPVEMELLLEINQVDLALYEAAVQMSASPEVYREGVRR